MGRGSSGASRPGRKNKSEHPTDDGLSVGTPLRRGWGTQIPVIVRIVWRADYFPPASTACRNALEKGKGSFFENREKRLFFAGTAGRPQAVLAIWRMTSEIGEFARTTGAAALRVRRAEA